jgi:hypothetical protein
VNLGGGAARAHSEKKIGLCRELFFADDANPEKKPDMKTVSQHVCGGEVVSRRPSLWNLLRALPCALLFLLAASCAGSTEVSSPKPTPATVLWSAGMETGDLSEWTSPGPFGYAGGGIFNSGIASSTASMDVAHSGTYSAKLAIITPNSPVSGVRLFRWLESQTHPQLHYSVWYYFPQSYTPAIFWSVLQWKSKHVVAGVESTDPFFNLIVWNRPTGEMYFSLRNENTNTTYDQSLLNIPLQQWIQVEAFYKCDGSGVGQVSFWQDGALLWNLSNVNTRYADGDCQWSVNDYSSGLKPSTGTIYVDDVAICLGGRCP